MKLFPATRFSPYTESAPTLIVHFLYFNLAACSSLSTDNEHLQAISETRKATRLIGHLSFLSILSVVCIINKFVTL